MKSVEVKTCGSCIEVRGLKVEELVDVVERGTMKCARAIKEADKVVCF